MKQQLIRQTASALVLSQKNTRVSTPRLIQVETGAGPQRSQRPMEIVGTLRQSIKGAITITPFTVFINLVGLVLDVVVGCYLADIFHGHPIAAVSAVLDTFCAQNKDVQSFVAMMLLVPWFISFSWFFLFWQACADTLSRKAKSLGIDL